MRSTGSAKHPMIPVGTIAEGITTRKVLLTKAESCFLFMVSSSEKRTRVIRSQVNLLTYPAVGYFTAGLSKAQLGPDIYKDPEVLFPSFFFSSPIGHFSIGLSFFTVFSSKPHQTIYEMELLFRH